MAYDDTLPTDKDYVRFLIGDTDSSNEKISDNEITALLAEEPNKYCAAAAALRHLLSKYGAKGEGILRKTVDELTIEYGSQGSPYTQLRERIKELQARCAEVRGGTTALFRVH